MKSEFNVRQIRYDVKSGLFPSRTKHLDDALINYLIDHESLSVVAARYDITRQMLFKAAERYKEFINLLKKRDKIQGR